MKFILNLLFSFIFGLHSLYGNIPIELASDEHQLAEVHVKDATHASTPCVIVIFGATGDLTARKLIPALYQLAHEGHLSESTVIVGFAREENTHEAFRQKMSEALDQFSRLKPQDSTFWEQFKNKIFYHSSDFENNQGYEKLQTLLVNIDKEYGTQGNRLYYLATPPSFFSVIIEKLHAHQLIYESNSLTDEWSRVMLEKPFGYDLNSALQLQQQIAQHLDKSQIYRIDHYLGKEGVQNLLNFRFKHKGFESIWNHDFIENIQITLAEDIGIGSRGHFWEGTGFLRDVVQNHLMQLLAIVAMEQPQDLQATTLHIEKIKVLNAIRPFSFSERDPSLIRAQYGPGEIQGIPVLGYREEKDVVENSSVETFVAAKLFIDNERWKGMPFFIRGGKRLAKQLTEIAITFKKNTLFPDQDCSVLFIRIQPNPGIFFKTVSNIPGVDTHLLPVVFSNKEDQLPEISTREAYERLIFDCIRGDNHLFVEAKEQFAAWRLLTPVLDDWKTHVPEDFPNYEAGTWGPAAADQMLTEQGYTWQALER